MFEKEYTIPYEYKNERVHIPRHRYYCLSCGHVQQYVDLKEREKGIRELVESAMKDNVALSNIGPYDNRQVSVNQLVKKLDMEYEHLLEVLREVVENHSGWKVQFREGGEGIIIPTLITPNDKLWLVGEEKT